MSSYPPVRFLAFVVGLASSLATFAQTPTERRGERVSRPTAFIIRPDMPGFTVAGIALQKRLFVEP